MKHIDYMKHILFFILLCIWGSALSALADGFTIRGRVVDKLLRSPVPYANVSLYGYSGRGATTDSVGVFQINNVEPGIYQLMVTCVGYQKLLSPEYIVSAELPPVELELEEATSKLGEVTVRNMPLSRPKDSPVSLQVIGLREIEKSPGGNRDISRIVRSYPGVSFSPIGYRNDLIVRGGSPSENRFYMDGIEISNINHFATQGASGGPVSILNADLIREVHFYTGAFPADKGGALSLVMEIGLCDGNLDAQRFKATLGASEVSLSGSGHVGRRTTYLFSARQSYLQLLFKVLGLPFLPNYVDGQFKVKTRFDNKDELVVLGLTGIDNMNLNTSETGEDAEYMLSYLPRIRQQTFTLGVAHKHYAGRHVQTFSVGYNYLRNQNLKYRQNDDSDPQNLTLDLTSREQKATLRAENHTYGEQWTWLEGVEAYYARYTDHTFQRLYQGDGLQLHNQQTMLGLAGWGAYASARYRTLDQRLTTTLGVRLDGSSFSARMFGSTSPPRGPYRGAFVPFGL